MILKKHVELKSSYSAGRDWCDIVGPGTVKTIEAGYYDEYNVETFASGFVVAVSRLSGVAWIEWKNSYVDSESGYSVYDSLRLPSEGDVCKSEGNVKESIRALIACLGWLSDVDLQAVKMAFYSLYWEYLTSGGARYGWTHM